MLYKVVKVNVPISDGKGRVLGLQNLPNCFCPKYVWHGRANKISISDGVCKWEHFFMASLTAIPALWIQQNICKGGYNKNIFCVSNQKHHFIFRPQQLPVWSGPETRMQLIKAERSFSEMRNIIRHSLTFHISSYSAASKWRFQPSSLKSTLSKPQ